MNRFVLTVLAFACIPTSQAAAPGTAPANKPLACEAPPMPGDTLEIKCPVAGTGAEKRYRAVVHFLGGHDDTSASFTAAADGQPLACDKSSKLSLFGEDGEVDLYCSFSLTHDAGSMHHVEFSVRWSHAQYDRFEVTEQ